MLIDSVSMNNFEAGRIAARHLIENGCRRIAFVTESGKTISRQDKIEGFLSIVSEAGASVAGSVIEGKAVSSYGDSEMADLGKTLAETISGMDARPDGIVAINDMLAIGLIAGFRSRGLKIPEDISIVGIDDMFLSALVTPAITSVSPPIAAMAKVMVDRLIARFSDPDIPVEEFLFAPTLVSRESVVRRRS
jgi:DNA-binding LacI/PurR family transcriptional regulator